MNKSWKLPRCRASSVRLLDMDGKASVGQQLFYIIGKFTKTSQINAVSLKLF